jgi:arylsulfatase A-like enzyme
MFNNYQQNRFFKGSLIVCQSLMSVYLAASNHQSTRPNIIFILTDDQSAIPIAAKSASQSRPFGFNGDANVYTPIIDSLARNGMIFPNAYVSSTVSAASRYSILTGRYPGRCEGTEFMKQHPAGTFTRVENNVELEKTFDNLPRLLQKAGYRTGFVGKSHVIDHQFLETGKISTDGYMTYTQGADPKNSTVNAAMMNNHNLWINRIKAYGFDYANAIYPANLKELNNDSLNVHNVEWKNKAALEFIDQAGNEPFFLYYSETLPHGPAPWTVVNGKQVRGLDANPRFTSAGYINADYSYLPDRSSVLKEISGMSDKDIKAAWLRWFDHAVGAVVKKLKDKGLLENTLIVITSDHGEYNHGKTTLYEGGIRVPLMMYWPAGIKANSRYEELVQNIDFTPTLLDVAGALPNPSKMDGVSLKNVISGTQTNPVHEFLFFEMGYARAVLTKDWKYITVRYDEATQKKINAGIRFPSFIQGETNPYPYYVRNSSLGYYGASNYIHYYESDQLYNMKNDPTEQVNVFGENKTVADNLKTKLISKLETFPGRPYAELFNGISPTALKNTEENDDIKIYPNPAKGVFQILSDIITSDSRYEIYNFEGKLVLQDKIIKREMEVNLSNYPTGNYFIKIYNADTYITGNLMVI